MSVVIIERIDCDGWDDATESFECEIYTVDTMREDGPLYPQDDGWITVEDGEGKHYCPHCVKRKGIEEP